MFYSRRDLGKIALATIPAWGAVRAFGAVNSKFKGVQIGVQTYSFRDLPDAANHVIPSMVQIGLGAAELMSEHAEILAGAPSGAELKAWRASVSKSASWDKFKEVRRKFDAAGVQLPLLCYNMSERTTDDEIEYGFQMAQALGVKAISTSTQVTVSKRVAPFADKYKMMVGYHGHDSTRPNEFATPESFATAMSYSQYHGVNLDIGHFTAANFDPVAYITEHHARITNIHLKDRKKNHGPNVPWGEGDTPIKEVLRLVAKEKYTFPADIEFEYKVPEGSDVISEVAKCLKYCKDALS